MCANNVYDPKYFEWQSKRGIIGGEIDVFKFNKHIRPSDKVIDFGCGGGYILKNITALEKVGVEINPSARAMAEQIGIATVSSINDLNNEWADIIISNHALEHVENPLDTLKELYKKLKKGGQIIFVVPCESIRFKYNKENIDKHLYTWSPINLGNLFNSAGFKVDEVKPFYHRWPPKAIFLYNLFGKRIFNLLSKLWGRLFC